MWVFYKQHADLLSAAATSGGKIKSDGIFPLFMVQQLPPGVSGLVIAGLFSAAMGAVCSGVNSISAALTTDFVRPFLKSPRERSMLLLARLLTLAAGLVATGAALVMARWKIDSFYLFFNSVLGLFTGGVAGLFVLGIFTRRATAWGSLIGAVAANGVMVAMAITWRNVPANQRPLHGMLYGVISLAVSIVIGYVASLLLRGRTKPLDGLTVFTSETKQASAAAREHISIKA